MKKVGPINALNGFPIWYEDQAGLRLMLNTDPNDPFNLITPADLPNPGQPVSFPDNFPEEAFYFTAEAEMETGTGERALLVLALEAAFVNEEPRDGEQIVFGRVRIRVAGLQPNAEYVVTHPYGTETFIAEPDGDGAGEINFTEDIGGLNGGNFELALNSRVFPFLTWDPNIAPSAPEGYIGDPNTLHPVTGSPFGEQQNIFRIEGPGIGIGSPDRVTDNRIETRNFSVSGKISTISGVDVTRTTYTQSDTAGGFLDVFATSDVTPQMIEVTGSGFNPTILEGENGLYFARVAFTGETPPSTVTVTNRSDNNPASIKESIPVDFITAAADYDNDELTLTITAFSSDEVRPVELTVVNFGDIPDTGGLVVNTIGVPADITIQSSAGGSRTIPVKVIGSEDPPIGVVANAGQDREAIRNTLVTLDGTGSTGPISSYQWIQIAGPEVDLVDADTATPSFVAPDNLVTLTFELTVNGEDESSSSDTVNIQIIDTVPAPVANAGPNQTVQQGSTVTLSGTSAGVVSSVFWEQISGSGVQIINPASPTASFIFPKQLETLVFRFTVIGPGGRSTDTVEISTVPDILTVTRAEFRTGDTEWRISGTSNVAGSGVSVTIFIGSTLGGEILAEVEVDALGEWEYRIEPSDAAPDATRAISIQSSSGGTLSNVPINVRN